MALQRPVPCRFKILIFLEMFFRSSPYQNGNGPAIVAISRFCGRYAEVCRKTKASNVRLGAVRAHSVKIGPDMHCCPTEQPIACLNALLFHYRSGVMRTELGDQQHGEKSSSFKKPSTSQAGCKQRSIVHHELLCHFTSQSVTEVYDFYLPFGLLMCTPLGTMQAVRVSRVRCNDATCLHPNVRPSLHAQLRRVRCGHQDSGSSIGYTGSCKQFPTCCTASEYVSCVSFVVSNIYLSCL